MLDFVAQQAGGSVRIAIGGRLDSMSAPVGGTIRGAGRCLRHSGPYLDTYAVQIAGWKPADFFGLPLITEGPTGPNGEFSFEAPLPAEIPDGRYGVAVSCGRCSGFAGCGVGFAFTIGNPPSDPTTTTGSTTTTTTKIIITTAAASAAGFTG